MVIPVSGVGGALLLSQRQRRQRRRRRRQGPAAQQPQLLLRRIVVVAVFVLCYHHLSATKTTTTTTELLWNAGNSGGVVWVDAAFLSTTTTTTAVTNRHRRRRISTGAAATTLPETEAPKATATKTSTTTRPNKTGITITKNIVDDEPETAAADDSFDVGDESVEFPPPLSTVDRLSRACTFWSCALPIVASYYGLMSRLYLQDLLRTTTTNDDDDDDRREEQEKEQAWAVLHERGATKLAQTITDLQGFYVKTAQIISSRMDLFPVQYTDALSGFTDNLDPMPAALAKAVVKSELLNSKGGEGGEEEVRFEDVFAEFDEVPLGAASVAQVHRAVLTPQYGGREVAVKIQRPSIESKLMGDIANLKAITKTFRDTPTLPLDYYTVFCELEKQLADEFDFVAEAVAMDRIYNSLHTCPLTGEPREVPLVMPRPVRGLVSRRVLVMDYLDGVPLSRARQEMIKRGVDPDSPEAKLFGRKLLTALTDVFGWNILETGFFHADPHPGNIFVLSDGRIGLIDFGQVKQISAQNRETLCKVMIALDERQKHQQQQQQQTDNKVDDADNARVGELALELGVKLKESAPEVAAAAVGIWLFDGTVNELPGGYDMGELSPNSPVKELASFPQDLVLVGRSSILIKGLSNRLGIPWSLAGRWAPIARNVLFGDHLNENDSITAAGGGNTGKRRRLRRIWGTARKWVKGKATKLVRTLPTPIRGRVASVVLKLEEWKARRTLLTRKSSKMNNNGRNNNNNAK